MMTRKTTWNDIGAKECVTLEYEWHDGVFARPGRMYIRILCPFCGRNVKAYVWSLAGGGKRCDCGTLFGSDGKAHKLSEEETQKASPG